MLRIARSIDGNTTVLAVSGRIDAEQLPELRRFIDEKKCARDLVIDLGEVSLVDVEVVRFLLRCEDQDVRIARCPAYVREWMARER